MTGICGTERAIHTWCQARAFPRRLHLSWDGSAGWVRRRRGGAILAEGTAHTEALGNCMYNGLDGSEVSIRMGWGGERWQEWSILWVRILQGFGSPGGHFDFDSSVTRSHGRVFKKWSDFCLVRNNLACGEWIGGRGGQWEGKKRFREGEHSRRLLTPSRWERMVGRGRGGTEKCANVRSSVDAWGQPYNGRLWGWGQGSEQTWPLVWAWTTCVFSHHGNKTLQRG